MLEMREETGDIFDFRCNWMAIPTNGSVKTNGEAVMGKGVALIAKLKVRGCVKNLGKQIIRYGNHVYHIGYYHYLKHNIFIHVFSFPTKYYWADNSDLELIKQSCEELRKYWKEYLYAHEGNEINPIVALTRPGCGCGNLDWKEVKPVIQKLLPEDNFVVVNKE